MAELPCFMGKVPDYEIVDGHMQIDLDGFRLVMPIHIFLKGCAKGKEAIKRWQASGCRTAEIIAFPAHGH